jgi:hypothetical protein
VPFDLLDDILLQDLALKAFERALQAFAIVNLNFSQRTYLDIWDRFLSVTAFRGNSGCALPMHRSCEIEHALGVRTSWRVGSALAN